MSKQLWIVTGTINGKRFAPLITSDKYRAFGFLRGGKRGSVWFQNPQTGKRELVKSKR